MADKDGTVPVQDLATEALVDVQQKNQPAEYGEYEIDADVGNVPALLIWIFVAILLWGIFAWIPFFGGVEGSQW